ncbi:uncharacterized protein TRIREDRAFT_110153 [Trichoderma reesei QM6a]|uniref:Predicted protein n=2 Tax=Hypocrea jecorina TaxID=51453 RepID=G0RRD0_HYPJQ|nr:uncharacterized protein TRIREDRAFT_110153 [Trichoderma reesei QM6a]EGR46226.1 predicted protein [Trichoderma reesei QM6a]ETR99238.1 hypothetical protein M419DRAFT_132572 [Trichoderma reesei RUT C-30]
MFQYSFVPGVLRFIRKLLNDPPQIWSTNIKGISPGRLQARNYLEGLSKRFCLGSCKKAVVSLVEQRHRLRIWHHNADAPLDNISSGPIGLDSSVCLSTKVAKQRVLRHDFNAEQCTTSIANGKSTPHDKCLTSRKHRHFAPET